MHDQGDSNQGCDVAQLTSKRRGKGKTRGGGACAYPQPLFILGSPRSFTSLICAMVGQHPQTYGMPELNLFAADTLGEFIEAMGGFKQIQIHGLLRALAHLYSGEQNLLSMEMARRWMATRLDWTTAQVYVELCKKVAPLRVVDKSPVYSQSRDNLERIRKAFPQAFYLHLTRNPRSQGESVLKIAEGAMAILANSIDYTTEPPTVDPQIAWFEMQVRIGEFLDTIPERRRMQVRGEDVLGDPQAHLRTICRWLEIAEDDNAIKAMMHPEDSPFACLGPIGAHLGNDINFLRAPHFRPGRVKNPQLQGTLPWRRDNREFGRPVLQLARRLGYE